LAAAYCFGSILYYTLKVYKNLLIAISDCWLLQSLCGFSYISLLSFYQNWSKNTEGVTRIFALKYQISV